MIDPMQAFDMEGFKKATSSLLIPTSTPTPTPTPSVAPIPSVVPNVPTYETIGSSGKTTLWVVFVIMFLSTLTFSYLAWRVPVQKRLFHVLTAFITLFATLSYYAMAIGDGNALTHIIVREVHNHTPDTFEHVYRQVFWARYVDWSLTTPLLLLDLSFLAGLNGANILVVIVADLVMVLTGLFAAYHNDGAAKWGWYAMGCVALLVIMYQMIIPGRRAVSTKDAKTSKLFVSIAAYTLIIWTLYPVVWGIGDGSRTWSVDAEVIAYAVLDVLAKPVFGLWLLLAHGSNVATSVDGWWSHGLSSEGSIRIEDDEGA
ncbi:opsin-1 [Sclerotinia borealis F-4128]|uniref:Opsin-1 n=1 Tax=Sclerotinia borealis (strain F-4128) TaxID=1432307 RepID=W9CVH4_SCLBF|nr:opsin-1 [Sclerotinia borealis F-4128]